MQNETPTKLKYPEIRRYGKFFQEQQVLLQKYADTYNKNKPGREQLKGTHIWLLDELIYYSQQVLEKEVKLFAKDDMEFYEPGTWIRVNLSKYLLARNYEQRKHPESIKRWKNRLIKAGAIVSDPDKFEALKMNKAHRNDVLINPDLMLIYDRYSLEYQPVSPYFGETEKQALWEPKRTNCGGVSSKGTLQELSNNEIRDVGDCEEKGASPAVGELNFSQDENSTPPDATPKLNGQQADSKEKNAKNLEKIGQKEAKSPVVTNQGSGGPAKIAEPVDNSVQCTKTTENTDKLTELRRSLSIQLYSYMVEMLFRFHEIYPAEAENAIVYLQEKYFSTVKNEANGQSLLKVYRWRVSKAESYIRRKNFDFSNIYPCHYIDIHNKTGFAATKEWYNRSLAESRKKAHAKHENDKRLAEKLAMDKLIRQYNENPNVPEYRRITNHLTEHAPHLCRQFILAVCPEHVDQIDDSERTN